MKSSPQIYFKPGRDLSREEISAVNSSKFIQWQSPPLAQYASDIFVLMKNASGTLLAHAQLYPLNHLKFNNRDYSAWGIGSVLAVIQHRGYGKKLLTAIRTYLWQNKLIGLGFTGPEMIGFFEKCGFAADCTLIPRFFSLRNGTKTPYINNNLFCVFYYDPENRLFAQILAHPVMEILIAENLNN